MKRFWKTARVIDAGAAYAVALDSRPVKLPSGNALAVPFPQLAKAIAQEWDGATPDFTPEDFPLTRLASTALERIAQHRDNIISQLAAYGMNDLLCYRADAPAPLVRRQQECWAPWLRWAEATHGLCLLTTTGLMPVNQLPWTAEKLTNLLAACSDYTLAALGVIVPALGSLVLSLALAAGELTPETACQAALLDELWQETQWGADDAAALRRNQIIADVIVSTRFMALCSL